LLEDAIVEILERELVIKILLLVEGEEGVSYLKDDLGQDFSVQLVLQL